MAGTAVGDVDRDTVELGGAAALCCSTSQVRRAGHPLTSTTHQGAYGEAAQPLAEMAEQLLEAALQEQQAKAPLWQDKGHCVG